jgi:hypothetical protein
MLGRSSFVAFVLVWVVCSVSASEPGVKVQIAGSTVRSLMPKSSLIMDLTGTESVVFRSGKHDFGIAYRKVNTVEYGQNVSRRFAEAVLISPFFLLSKSRKHFVTLGYLDEENKQQAIVLRIDKSDIRSVLAGLEARTGRRIEYQDGEARKAAKG